MDMRFRPIEDRIAWIFSQAQQYADQIAAGRSGDAGGTVGSTVLASLECMDGRLHLPSATGTLPDRFVSFRNLGGIFDLGWPYLSELLADRVDAAGAQGRRVLLLLTYHFSRGSRSRGCAGFHCDRAAAMRHAEGLRRQALSAFGRAGERVYPLVCGFETDEDALILHAPGGDCLDLAAVGADGFGSLQDSLQRLLPDMPQSIQRDLLPLLFNNVAHIAEIRQQQRDLDREHCEWMIGVGRGFDFLRLPNTALLVGPYDPDLSHPISTAATIIRSNMERGRIPDDGFFLLASMPVGAGEFDATRAALKSAFLADFAARLVREEEPWLAERMHLRSAIFHPDSGRLEILDQQDSPRLSGHA
ncbi:hypothetical protein J2T57_002469 [Natronocella acetinitrilica]|uniref:Carboxysome Shell Carbonic Anhydrase catalytic domain-containing protein n=1 Tax=Natronocella acetinitrilica TaxID=414046 RepID=A0AAE3KC48_9GAMM|nr:carboxysome shell carbonic anhydrase [Natronocella acetinitrilica]MCP1675321.1 hypothetical protein [Natronocella acetinitrilica]